MHFGLDLKIMVFTHLLAKSYNLFDNKNMRDELIDNFNKTKTLIFYANSFFEEDLSDAEDETLRLIESEKSEEANNLLKYKRLASFKQDKGDSVLG